MIMEPLCINKIKISNNFIDVVENFKYLGENINFSLNEKEAWKDRITKLSKGQQITKNTYNKKCLSIHTKLKHYKTTLRSQAMYSSETIFNLSGRGKAEDIRKIERRILRTCINKKNIVDGQHRLLTNKQICREIEPITDAMRKKRVSFFGHILRTPENRILRKIVEKLYNSKNSNIQWIKGIKEDLAELEITITDLKEKSPKYKQVINDKSKQLHVKTRKLQKRVYSVEERQKRSERMKKYWEQKLKKTQKKVKTT